MERAKRVVTISALFGLMTVGAFVQVNDARADDKKVREESAEQAQRRSSKARQVSGTVLDTKNVKFKGTDQQNTVALINTTKNDRRLVIDLGPKEQLKGMNLKKGQQLAAKGVVVSVGDQQILVADQIKRGDKTMKIDRVGQIQKLEQSQKGKSAQPGMQGQGSTKQREGAQQPQRTQPPGGMQQREGQGQRPQQ